MVSGTGIKNKLLEAMAAGAPAVATTLATQGIDASHVLVADSDAEFAAALVTLLKDRQRAGKQADAARAYVRARHDWDAVAAAYLALYQDIS
jgi:glycosyltransferase involved in cell wall biosynthesis